MRVDISASLNCTSWVPANGVPLDERGVRRRRRGRWMKRRGMRTKLFAIERVVAGNLHAALCKQRQRV